MRQPMPQRWRAAARSPIEPTLAAGDRAIARSWRQCCHGWEAACEDRCLICAGSVRPARSKGGSSSRMEPDPLRRLNRHSAFPTGQMSRHRFGPCSQRQEHSRSSAVEALPVDAEVDIHRGLPAFSVVGLPDAAVRESRERVRAAIVNSGFEFPLKRITVSLAPSDLRKAGPGFDLAIAAGILVASGQLPELLLRDWVFAGELALDGRLRRVRGRWRWPMWLACAARRESSCHPTAPRRRR